MRVCCICHTGLKKNEGYRFIDTLNNKRIVCFSCAVRNSDNVYIKKYFKSWDSVIPSFSKTPFPDFFIEGQIK